MEPWFSQNDKILFYKYLDKATIYFEYGSGASTYQAYIRNNISKIYSVESDIEWLNKIKHKINSDKLMLLYNEMDVRPNTLGYPGKDSIPIQLINYSNQILNISKDEQQKIDLFLIDGRFRVACCLKLFDIISSDCLIAFDDFLNRKEYHIVLDYYNIIEKTVDERMVILQKKRGIISIPEDIIKKYELISK
jgi:hypothetical protein